MTHYMSDAQISAQNLNYFRNETIANDSQANDHMHQHLYESQKRAECKHKKVLQAIVKMLLILEPIKANTLQS